MVYLKAVNWIVLPFTLKKYLAFNSVNADYGPQYTVASVFLTDMCS